MDLTNFLNTKIWGGLKWTLALENRLKDERYLEQYGYKIYSQNDEDGIINEIFRRIGTINKTFVEFGVDRGLECNSHALLLQGWRGLWIEGTESSYAQICRRFAPAIRKGILCVINDYVTINNINGYISEYCKGEELDLLSIDIDGNDYHIWQSINEMNPRVVVIEYQGRFAPEIDWVMAYNTDCVWDGSDRSGASLKALEKLGNKKGYQLVGTNISGVNAFFVRKDLCGDWFPLPATSENLYNPVRSNIVGHENGNRPINFVGQDIEGIEGVFEYYPDWNSLPGFGFRKMLVTTKGQKNIMSEKKARMYIRNIPKTCSKILIEISTDIDIKELNGEIELRIEFENIQNVFDITQAHQIISFPINGAEYKGKIIPIDFATNYLWIPSEFGERNDIYFRGAL